MLYGLLLAIMILLSLVLIAAILLQSGKGSGLAANFGGAGSSSDAVMGVRQAGNLLTHISWYGGGTFLFLALVLQLMSTRASAPTSVLDQPIGATAPAAPAAGQGAAPSAVPLEPVAPAAATPAGSPAPTTQPK